MGNVPDRGGAAEADRRAVRGADGGALPRRHRERRAPRRVRLPDRPGHPGRTGARPRPVAAPPLCSPDGSSESAGGHHVSITHSIDDDGIAEVVMDNPPVNALHRRRLVRAGRRRSRALGDDPDGPGRRAAGRGPGLQRRRRHQGDAGDRGLRRPDRRQPGLLRRLRRRLRVRGAGDRRRARVLPRRRHRPRRQRRRHRRLRRRHLRAARGRPRRARRRHPPGPAGAPAQDAGDGLHVGHRDRGRAAPLRLGAAGRAARRAPRARRSRSPRRSRRRARR